METVSSAALAKAAGVKATQLRKDLTYFGQFGTRGLGYSVEALSKQLTDVLGTTRLQPVDPRRRGKSRRGAAALSKALRRRASRSLAAFDVEGDENARESEIGVQVLPMTRLAEFMRRADHIKMVDPHGARPPWRRRSTNELVGAGVLAILNFAPIVLQVPDNVVVNNVDLAIELENLSYFIQ